MTDFARTYAELRSERVNATLWFLAGAVVVFAAWLCWGCLARISLSQVSSDARIEAVAAVGRAGLPVCIVAFYPAQTALGRIHVGDAATLRLDGFPWTQFGALPATVTRVGRDGSDGRLRVELAVREHASFRGSLQPGLSGTLDVTVDTVSPLELLLRSAGQWLTRPS